MTRPSYKLSVLPGTREELFSHPAAPQERARKCIIRRFFRCCVNLDDLNPKRDPQRSVNKGGRG